MGYSTNYSLKVELLIGSKVAELVDKTPLLSLVSQLMDESEDARGSLQPNGKPSGNGFSWREHESDLRVFSLKHPNILFTLHGEGEEAGDIWNKYFLNGKCQEARAILTIAGFDPGNLK
jgi:hypothetical protein